MKIKRHNNYDLLRIIACIAVIILHVSAIYIEAYTTKNELTYKIDLTHIFEATTLNVLTRFAVPIFVMLTGAFSLSNPKNKDYKEFYKKIFKRIGLPIIIFSILFSVYALAESLALIVIKNKDCSVLLKTLKDILTGSPYFHLWYLYMLIEVYLLIPIVIRFKESISEKHYIKVAIIFMILASISGFTSKRTLMYDIGYNFNYIGYLMLGDILKTKYEKNKSNSKFIVFIILSIVFETIVIILRYNNVLLKINENDEKYTLVGNFNPLISLATICIFIAFSNLNLNKDFTKLSSLTFYIYIFHAIILDLIAKTFKLTHIINENTNSNFEMFYLTIIVFALSYIASKIWLFIWSKINKEDRIHKKIDTLFEKI